MSSHHTSVRSSLSEILNLEDNLFTGAIPEEIGNAVELTTLKLTNNQLVGTVPSSIGAMSNLGML
jgi:hypothetical protein